MDAEPAYLPEQGQGLLSVLRAAVANRPPAAAPACWEALFQHACQQEVAAFLYPVLRLWPPAVRPPDPLLARWRTSFLASVAQAARRTEQAREVLVALAAADIHPVPLKGIWLAEAVYADPAQRPMNDIDLLVRPAEIGRARQVIEQLGYTIWETHPTDRFDYALTACSPRYAQAIELHWKFDSEQTREIPSPDLSGLWNRLTPATVAGVTVPTLSDEEHLVLLVHHALHHAFAMPLRELLDLALLMRRREGSLDTERFRTVASAWKLERAAPLLAGVVADLFGCDLPVACLTQQAPLKGESRRLVMQTLLAASDERVQTGETTLLEFGRRGPWGRLGLVIQRIFVPRAFLLREYPCARLWIGLPVAYGLRMRDLVRQRHAAIRGIVRRDAAVMERAERAERRRHLAAWLLQGEPEPENPERCASRGRARPSA